MPIVTKSHKPGGYVVFRTTSTDGFDMNFAGGGVPAANNPGETVTEMRISEVLWSVKGAQTWTVTRGGNTVLVLSGSGHHDYQRNGIRLEASHGDLIANVHCVLSSGDGTIILKMHKSSGE